MLAVDTNVILRVLLNDMPTQAERARRFLEDHDTMISATVLLETAWVLGKVGGFGRAEIADGLASIAALPRVTLDHARFSKALAWYLEGMDIADAMHLAQAEECEAMVSFDQKFAQHAKAAGALPVREP